MFNHVAIMKVPIIFIILTLALCSCSRKYYSKVDRVIPAKIDIPTDIQSIMLLDRSKEKNIVNRVQNVMADGWVTSNEGKRLLKGLSKKLSMATSIHSKSLRHSNDGTPADRMSLTEVNTYIGSKDGLLALEQFVVQEFRTYERIQKHQLDQNGNDYIIDAVKGIRINSLKTQWRLYDKENGTVLFTLPYEVEEVFEAEGLNNAGVNAKMDSLNVVGIDDLISNISQQISNDFNPKQIRSSWMYFTKGSKLIERSGRFIKEGKFKNAIQILRSNPRIESDDKVKIRVCYNLTTALFISGKTDEAFKEAKRGVSLYNDKELKQLLDKID